MNAIWISPPLLRELEAEGTNAFRLCTATDGWLERFDRDLLLSFKTEAAREFLLAEQQVWSASFVLDRIFARFLPRKNAEREAPKLLQGNPGASLRTVATESSLRYAIDFGAGYSVGLFVDQRENRRFLRKLSPKKLLNCFAYTCSFSVAAASAGAATVNIDLSRKSLDRGRDNFFLNNLSTSGHRFVADDVLDLLPRLARKGERFDAIILDPPTFSRSHRGQVFQIESDFEALLSAALEVAAPHSHILLSTNCSSLSARALEKMARFCLKAARRTGRFMQTPAPADFPDNSAASTVWLMLC